MFRWVNGYLFLLTNVRLSMFPLMNVLRNWISTFESTAEISVNSICFFLQCWIKMSNQHNSILGEEIKQHAEYQQVISNCQCHNYLWEMRTNKAKIQLWENWLRATCLQSFKTQFFTICSHLSFIDWLHPSFTGFAKRYFSCKEVRQSDRRISICVFGVLRGKGNFLFFQSNVGFHFVFFKKIPKSFLQRRK